MFTISLFSRIDRCAHRQSWPESLRAAALFQNVPVPLLLRLSWLCPSRGCESRVSARYFISGYAASGQTQGRAAMSSVPPSLCASSWRDSHHHDQIHVLPYYGRMVGPRQILCGAELTSL